VLKTQTVRVQLHQKGSGAARIVVDVADAKTRDAIVEAIKGAVKESENGRTAWKPRTYGK
jgi:hypothetical protein